MRRPCETEKKSEKSSIMVKVLGKFDFKGKKVLLRCDLNVPISEDGLILSDSEKQGSQAEREVLILNDFRIKQSVPTIRYLIERGAKVIIISHLGDPDGRVVNNLRLDRVKEKLADFLGLPVLKTNDCVGNAVKNTVAKMQNGEVLLLENIRFHSEEEDNNEQFSKELASLGDIYINDAFGVCHREHTSVVGIPKYLPSGAGLLLEKEIKVLSGVLENPWRPLVVVIGGIKIATKIKMIEKFIKFADHVLLGGGIANTILIGKGVMIGAPLPEKEILEKIDRINLTDAKIHLPIDGIIVLDKERDVARQGAIGTFRKEEAVLDIGPETIKIFKEIIKEAKMIVWNGPLGLSEDKRFKNGTKEVAQEITRNHSAFKVAGGGETVEAISKFGLFDKFDHVSTGGGAMLDFLSGEKLPGIIAIDK